MKRLLIITLCTLICTTLMAEFTPYGSARLNYFFNMYNKDYMDFDAGIDVGRTTNDHVLSAGSNVGLDYELDNLTANVEFFADTEDGDAKLGLFSLWAKYSFEGWSLMAGQAEDGTCHVADQTWGDDAGLIGYGAAYGDANPQIRFELDNGLYLAVIKPYTEYNEDDEVFNMLAGNINTDPDSLDTIAGSIDNIIPKLNLGWDITVSEELSIMPTGVFQMYKYNKDFSGYKDDVTITSWLGALTVEYAKDAFSAKCQFNYGSNTGNMGYEGPANLAVLDDSLKVVDTTTMGGFLMLGYDFAESFNLNGGVGFATSSNDQWDNDDAHMACYLQGVWSFDDFSIIPEVGFINEMTDRSEDKTARGNIMYGGLQLRYDF